MCGHQLMGGADVLRPWRVGSRRIGTAGRGSKYVHMYAYIVLPGVISVQLTVTLLVSRNYTRRFITEMIFIEQLQFYTWNNTTVTQCRHWCTLLFHNKYKKLSYRRETERQLPTWREGAFFLQPTPHSPPLAIPMRMVESESYDVGTSSLPSVKRTLRWIGHSRSFKVILIGAGTNPERCVVVMCN